MCLGNSVSIVRICCSSVACVINLNSLNYDNMIVIGKCERMSRNSPAAVLHFWSITRQSSFMMKGDYLQSWSAYQTESEEEALAKAMQLSLMEDEKSSRKAVSTTVEHAVLLPHYFIGQSSFYYL